MGLDSQISQVMINGSKFCGSMNYGLIWLFTSELYPSSCRTTALALCAFISACIGAALPYMNAFHNFITYYYLLKYFKCNLSIKTGVVWLPSIILGSSACLSALLCLTLPDTTNMPLISTLKECEDFHKSAEIPFGKLVFSCKEIKS